MKTIFKTSMAMLALSVSFAMASNAWAANIQGAEPLAIGLTTSAAVIHTTPDTLIWPNGFELDTASYIGDGFVPTVKKSISDDTGMLALKSDVPVDDGSVGHVTKSFVLASADIPLEDGVIKADGSVVNGKALGEKRTF
jgi:hypothetical protein